MTISLEQSTGAIVVDLVDVTPPPAVPFTVQPLHHAPHQEGFTFHLSADETEALHGMTGDVPGHLADTVAAQIRRAYRREFVTDHVAEFGGFTEEETERAAARAHAILGHDDATRGPHASAVVLDHEAFAALVRDDRGFVALFDALDRHGADFFLSPTTIVEGTEHQAHAARVSQALKGLSVAPVTERTAWRSVRTLRDAGLHGSAHAVDAVVAELASRLGGGTIVLTPDIDAMRALVGDAVRVVAH